VYTNVTYHTVENYKEILSAGINTPIEVFRSYMDCLFQHQYRLCLSSRSFRHIPLHTRDGI